MKSDKQKKKAAKEKKEQEPEEEENELEPAVRVYRGFGNDQVEDEVKPITQFFKTGDRAGREKAPVIDKQSIPNVQDILNSSTEEGMDIEESVSLYTPITKESKFAYDEILGHINRIVPDQPHSYIVDLAFEFISIIKNESLSETGKKTEVSKIVKISDEAYYKMKVFAAEINDFQTKKTMQNALKGDKILNLDLSGSTSKKKIEIQFETMQIEDEVENESQRFGRGENSDFLQDQKNNESFDRTTLKSLLIGLGKSETESAELCKKILPILGFDDDIEVQNNLFAFDEYLDMTFINYLYEKRFELFYGYQLDTYKANPDKFNEYIDKIRGSKVLSSRLKYLMDTFQQIGAVFSELVSVDFSSSTQKSKLKLESITLEELSRLPKKNISLKPKQEELISFSSAPLKLPKNSTRIADKGYEEITIPYQSTPLEPNEKMLKIDTVPEYFREAFGDLKTFNRIQSKVFDFAFNSNKNLLLCAPTGAGKTIVAIFSILGLLNSHRDPKTQMINLSAVKIVYLAPMKALVSEIVSTFNYRLNYLGIKASEFTGDIHLTMEQFEDASIIVSTPEKWDVLSRKSTERQFNEKLKLLIVDEVHLLGDSRGPVIEAVVLRTLNQKNVRVVALSATLPNYEDVARFLDVDFNEGLFYFNNTYRPVPLSQTYIGISESSGIKKMAMVKDLLFKKVLERIKDYQILVFVHSRKETVKTALEIKETAFAENVEELFVTENSKKIIDGIKGSLVNSDLQSILCSGIGFHHAGLPRGDRKYVEDLFSSGHLSVLISTATLAWGVNLPAHTVIIKNTQVYSADLGKWVPLSTQNLLQMLGRAGRPLYDREGEGIIMTSSQEMRHYMSFLNEQQAIESSLLASLPEILNAEIVLGNIQNIKEACVWMSKTYLFQRLRRSPRTYGLNERIDSQENQITTFVIDAIHTAASDLMSVGLIKYHRERGLLEPTPEGRIASFFYIKPENMKIYSNGLQNDLNEIDLLRLFTSSIEFRNIVIREEEKIELAKLYSLVPIPIKGPVDDPKSKINVLLQCYLSRVELEGYALNCDMKFVSENAQRIFRSIFELSLHKKSASCQIVLDFCKMTERRVWKELSPLRQYAKLNDKILQRIEQQEHLTFDHFKTMSVTQINNIVKNDQSASYIHGMIKKFPRLETSIYVQILSRTMVRVSLNYTAEFEWDSILHGQRLLFRVFIFDVDQEKLLYHQPFMIHKYDCLRFKEEKTVEFNLAIQEPLQPHYFIKIVSDDWLSCENTLPVSFKNVFLPTKFPLCREEPTKSTEQNESDFLVKYGELLGIRQFNGIQIDMFNCFFNSFNNIYLGAIKNAGKFTLALVAIIRLYSETKNAKCVILFSNDGEMECKSNLLSSIAQYLQIEIAFLGGILQKDINSLTSAQLIVSSAQNFERLTRNYKKRPQLKQVRMVIATDLSSMAHSASSYEVVLARVRLVFSLLGQKYRLIALSTPIANFSSVCDWLGIEPEYAFNFHNNLRNVDLNVLINTVESIQSGNFLEVTAKKLVSIVKLLDTGLRSIVALVDTVESARIFGSLLLKEFLFFKVELESNSQHEEVLKHAQNSFDDVFNVSFLEYGFAYLSNTTSPEEVSVLQKLFRAGILKVLVSTKDTVVRLTEIEPVNVVLVNAGKFGMEDLSLVSGILNKISPETDFESFEKNKNNLIVFLHEWEKESFKEAFLEPSVVESQLGFNFIDVLNVEIVSGGIQKKEECVDWLTWTYFYRRLSHNPNYYNLSSNDPLEINDYISELIDAGLADLEESKCVEISDSDVKSENNGVIASFYDLKIPTIMGIFNSIDENFAWRSIFHTIASANEFSEISLAHTQFKYFENIAQNIPLKAASSSLKSLYFKIFISIQAYLTRVPLSDETELELEKSILPSVLKMLNGFIDCSNSLLVLKPALLAMKLSQMINQRIWYSDNSLKQLPFFEERMIEKAKNLGVLKLEDFLFMEDGDRDALLSDFSEHEKTEVARFSNAFPNVQIEAKLVNENSRILEGEEIIIDVEITRDGLEDDFKPEVCNLGLVKGKEESWWISICDRDQNKLFYVKKIQFGKEYKKRINVSSTLKGSFNISVLLICDWCNGFDAEISNLAVQVIEREE